MMAADSAQVEEISSTSSISGDELSKTEVLNNKTENLNINNSDVYEAAEYKNKQTRNEKKARKMLLKLGVKPIPGIEKIIIEKRKHALFVINKPDVFLVPGTQSYVIFGEAKIEEPNSAPQFEAAKRYVNSPEVVDTSAKEVAEVQKDEVPADDGEGLDASQIETVMSQGNCTRARAIRALRQHGDLIDAVLDVTA